ncbi:unnamed protein product [Caenorhabditis brenneri]
MSDSTGTLSRGNRKTFRDAAPERNGFNNARILPPKGDDEQRRIYKREAKDIIKRFLRSGNLNTTLEVMNREQRKVMHEVAQQNDLITRSTGKEPNRCIILSMREKHLSRSSLVHTDPIAPSPESLSILTDYVTKDLITEGEMTRFLTEKGVKKQYRKRVAVKNKPSIPPKSSCPAALQKTRDNLPASKCRDHVLQSIESKDIVIISGGTGCGKTTQVPQFILEDAYANNKPVRIMVTQPRRIAAISIAERVAKERGERLGGTVGYQIRLESRKSDNTLLTYCTTGVLLRMLTTDPVASGLTHIIMDEIHEREINTDYLLIAIRECLKHRSDLKVILMSATIEGNMQLFESYFQEQTVEVIRIESRTFDVKILYLDQILALSGYEPPESKVFFASSDFKLEDWETELKEIKEKEEAKAIEESFSGMQITENSIPCNSSVYGNGFDSQPNVSEFYVENSPAWGTNSDEFPNHVINTVNEWHSGPYQTSNGGIIDEKTMQQFMSSTGASDFRPPVTLEFCPSKPDSVTVNGRQYNAGSNQSPGTLHNQQVVRQKTLNWPLIYHCTQPSAVIHRATVPLAPVLAKKSPLIADSGNAGTPPSSGLSGFSTVDFGGFGKIQRSATALETEFRRELKTTFPNRTVYYHPQMNEALDATDFKKLRLGEKYEMFYGSEFENAVDLHLLNHVLRYLADSPIFGTILVFLPGFEDINLVMKMIEKWQFKLTNMKHVIKIPLHSQIHSINHGDIFKPVNKDTRKIILATNIAEASITIEDVIFVVDTGKVKQFSYNHEAKLNILSVNSIAKSNADQRSGRAGRVTNGYCVRLYSEQKYNSMLETQVAEMKRSAIYEVTLHAKSFAPDSMRIADFLALAPEPPEKESIAQSIVFLEQLGAFYKPSKNIAQECDVEQESEQEVDPELTDLGLLMAKLPLDPQLSRMLLFGLALKCLTPIVNLVALLASRDPYLLPQSDERDKQWSKKFDMAGQDFSDHLMFIRLCSEFCSMSSNEKQNEFCRDNYLNISTMKMINGTRRQLLQELSRAKLINVQDRDIMTALSDPLYNKHSDSWAMVQGAIAAGCYPSIGVSSAESLLKKIQTFNDRAAGLHPSSILKKLLPKGRQVKDVPRLEYVAFQEMSQMSSDRSLAVKIVTAIPALTALLFTGPIRLNQQIVEEYGLVSEDGEIEAPEEKGRGFGSNQTTLNLDDWYGVQANKNNLRLFLRLRHKFMYFLLNGIEESSIFAQGTTDLQHKMLNVIRHLLETEHTRYKYSPVEMPVVGQKPSHNYKSEEAKKTNFRNPDHSKKQFVEREDRPVRKFRSENQSFSSTQTGSTNQVRSFLSYHVQRDNQANESSNYGSTPRQMNWQMNRNLNYAPYAAAAALNQPPPYGYQGNFYGYPYQQLQYPQNQHQYPRAEQHNNSFSGYTQNNPINGVGRRGKGKGAANNRGRSGVNSHHTHSFNQQN